MATIRLNLGCGGRTEQGFVNVDGNKGPHVDEVWDVFDLGNYRKFADNSVSEIRAWHILEHCHVTKASEVLREWRRILTPGGGLDIRVPDLMLIMQVCVMENRLLPELMHHIYAFHIDEWDEHHWGYDERSFGAVLEDTGFEVVKLRRNINGWELQALAIAP